VAGAFPYGLDKGLTAPPHWIKIKKVAYAKADRFHTAYLMNAEGSERGPLPLAAKEETS